MNQPSTGRRVAAAATALLLSGGVLFAPAPAQAAKKAKPMKGNVSKTVPLSCELASFGSTFEYDAAIKLTGKRAKKKAKKVTLTATMSDLPGLAPVPIPESELHGTLVLDVAGAATTLTGKHMVSAEPLGDVPVPKLKGKVNNKKNKLAVAVTSLDFNITASGIPIDITCVPSGNGKMGKLKLK